MWLFCRCNDIDDILAYRLCKHHRRTVAVWSSYQHTRNILSKLRSCLYAACTIHISDILMLLISPSGGIPGIFEGHNLSSWHILHEFIDILWLAGFVPASCLAASGHVTFSKLNAILWHWAGVCAHSAEMIGPDCQSEHQPELYRIYYIII